MDNFIDLRRLRERSFYYRVIFQMVDLLKEIQEEILLPDYLFEHEVSCDWGEDETPVRCFAFNLDDIFEGRHGA